MKKTTLLPKTLPIEKLRTLTQTETRGVVGGNFGENTAY